MSEPAAPEHTGGVLDAEDALRHAGVAAFRWRAGDDRVSFAGEVAGLELSRLGEDATWADFVALFAAPDQAELLDLPKRDDGVQVVLARLAERDGKTLRLRIRASWSERAPRALAGVIAPAFGGVGESAEHEESGRLGLEIELRRAVERLDFEAWYQPIVNMKTERVDGFEALVRWPSAERGLLPPDDFLPLAVELELDGRINGWMRDTVARRLKAWRAKAPDIAPRFISFNAGVEEIASEPFVDAVADLISTHDLPKGSLKIEMTEGEVMRDPDRVAAHLAILKDAGASLALDDFGAGFSSLSRLERFAFDVVKIDRYFIRTLIASPASRKIVGSIAELSQSLGMEVVAEGVETDQEAMLLIELGCDHGQGFWFAPAMPASEALDFARARLSGA